jgi:hypothetical protein
MQRQLLARRELESLQFLPAHACTGTGKWPNRESLFQLLLHALPDSEAEVYRSCGRAVPE